MTVSALTSEGQGPSSESVTDTTLEGRELYMAIHLLVYTGLYMHEINVLQ